MDEPQDQPLPEPTEPQDAESTQRRGPVARWIGWVVGLLAALTLAVTLMGFLGNLAWWLDVLNEPRMQWMWLSLLLAVVLLIVRSWVWLAVAVVALLINAVLVVPWMIGSHPAPPPGSARDLRIMALNVRFKNETFQPVLDLIREREPEIVVLNEVDPQWLEQIREMQTGYRIYDTPVQDKFGVLLLSRHPIESVDVERFTGRWSPSLVAHLRVNGQPAILIATHPPAPLSSQTWQSRNEHLAELADYVSGLDVPVLVAGDLNTTMWSPHFDQLLDESGLLATRDGFGIEPTFPASRWGVDLPWIARVPLDHVLASPQWTVYACETGPHVGSDHLPLILDVGLPQSPATDVPTTQ